MNHLLRGTVGLTIVCALALLPTTWGLGAPPAYHLAFDALQPGVLPWDAYAEPSQPRRLPEVDAAPLEIPVEAPPFEAHQMAAFAPPSQLPDPAPNDTEYFTLDELKAEMKKLAWTKGDFTIVPYGYLWASMIYETDRTFPGAYTLFVPSRDKEGEDAFIIDARRTRLGMNVAGPRIPLLNCAESGAKVEIDFHSSFIVENKPGILLRHAYWEAKDETFRLLVGQTWDVISPLYPNTLMYSVAWAAGNIGYRRAQFRLERYLACSDRVLLTVQGSLNQDIVSDLNATAGVDREPVDWPVVEGRTAITLGPRGPNCLPITFGVSGHIGEQGFDFLNNSGAPNFLPPADDARIGTWSLGADVHIPLTSRLGVQGEFFYGENLGTFLGGIVRGVCPSRRDGIRSVGGWAELWYDWTPRLHSHFGFTIDDPVDGDLLTGRKYNHQIFGNMSYDVTKHLNTGLEISSWKTLHKGDNPGDPDLSPGESVRFEFVVRYGF